jgi:hypothetical protein
MPRPLHFLVSCSCRSQTIFVKSTQGRTTTVRGLRATHTIAQVKEKIHDLEGIPPARQRLMYMQRCVDDERTLAHYNVQNESTWMILLKSDQTVAADEAAAAAAAANPGGDRV